MQDARNENAATLTRGRIRRACHAHDGASRGERHRKVGLTPGCRQASGKKPQVRRGRWQPGLCPICEGCNRRCSASQPRRGAKIETWPQLSRHGKLEGLSDAPKDIALGDTAGIAFVNSGAQRGKLRFVLLLLALQSPQPGSHNLTGVFVTPALNLLGDEAVKLLGQIDVAGRHSGGPSMGGI